MSGTAPPPPSPVLSPDGASLPPGHRLQEYLIERTLGGGGFGITYLARDENLHLTVAVKEYFPADLALRGAEQSVQVRSGDGEARASFDWGLERFLDEARALAAFRHPNIIRVLRYFRANGTAYIVMEYETGLPLKRWVPQNAPLNRRSVLALLQPLLDGLEAVHDTGFLHRDIKPDNIYVRADGTPVLLDFGAARRVSGGSDMTNIVSPGFAPFEQYHSHGRQGPWTDLYSLGAVAYWMVTARKPVEAAARVQQDSMLPATSLADPAVFGADLLAALDWALQPDEGRRPRSVGEFRAALGDGRRRDDAAARAGDAMPIPGAAGALSPPALQRRTLVCTLMALDLVGFAARPVDDQAALRKLFNDVMGKALRAIPPEVRIAVDTGTGAAVCFLGDPEEALQSALLLRDLLSQRCGAVLPVRIGLHMGPVRIIADLNGRTSVVGDGINVAQRVMDFAQADQVLVSRAYYDVVSRITEDSAALFSPLGQYEDSHGRHHEVYSVAPARGSRTRPQGPSTGYTQTLPVKDTAALDDALVQDVEGDLARHIGPLAKVLVRKARPMARSAAQLRELLAPTIQDARTREAFMQPPPNCSQPVSKPFRAGPSSQSMPLSPSSGASPSLPPGARAVATPEELAVIEAALSRHIGPMGRVIARKEAPRHAGLRDYVHALAASIDKAELREVFIRDLKRTLPRRPRA